MASPTWVSTLKTASLRADLTTVGADGQFTVPELRTALTNLSASLDANGLTVDQFSDLQAAAMQLNTKAFSHEYVAFVFNALVNGNPANAQFTGGTAVAALEGNLAVGSPSALLNTLIGEWLLGTDLPSSRVVVDGVSTFNVSHTVVARPLFEDPPTIDHIRQGNINDCYFLSALAAFVYLNPVKLQSMFVDNGDGTYGVRFYGMDAAPTPHWVTVNSALANGGAILNREPSGVWASLAEKAYAQYADGDGNPYGNSYSAIGNGGDGVWVLRAIAGGTAFREFCGDGPSSPTTWLDVTLNNVLGIVKQTDRIASSVVLAAVKAALKARNHVILCSETASTISGKGALVASHYFTVWGVAANGDLLVRNPWGPRAGYLTSFATPLAALAANRASIFIDNAGALP